MKTAVGFQHRRLDRQTFLREIDAASYLWYTAPKGDERVRWLTLDGPALPDPDHFG